MTDRTRRQFLSQIAAAGGSLAVYNTAMALDLIGGPSPIEKFSLKPATGKETIAIIGGGIAGLAIAHELGEAGYKCVILEASHRLGGRNLTVRGGDLIDELGRPNYCQFDKHPDLYLNTGPARIPGHHRRLLNYCKKFNIHLELKSNHNPLAYSHNTNHDAPAVARQQFYISDARGFLSELAWKAIDKNVFEQKLTSEDLEKLEVFVREYGSLDKNGKYKGTPRSGSQTDRMLTHGPSIEPMPIDKLLHSDFWFSGIDQMENFDWLGPLMQPKGGMDKVVDGFANNIKAKVKLKAQVQAVNMVDGGVSIRYQHEGEIKTLNADYCFNNMPGPFMPGIQNNFSSEYRDMLSKFERRSLYKIGFQMKKRFWEDEGIYGGITYSNHKINQIWYPSHDINAEKGIVLGAYVWGQDDCHYFSNLSLEDRIKVAAEGGSAIHPKYAEYIEVAVSVPWHRMNNMMGCGSRLEPKHFDEYFHKAQRPEAGRHFMVGDQVSYHPGWQEGALASAEVALKQFNELVSAT